MVSLQRVGVMTQFMSEGLWRINGVRGGEGDIQRKGASLIFILLAPFKRRKEGKKNRI